MVNHFEYLYIAIALFSFAFIFFLRERQFVKGTTNGNAISKFSNKLAGINISDYWLLLGALLVLLCFFINADFALAAFYAIFVAIGLLVVAFKFSFELLKPNAVYSNPLTKKNIAKSQAKSQAKSHAVSFALGFVRLFNIIILSPILAGALGILFHSYVPDKEVNLVVYTAFIGSISYAGFIAYYASTKRNLIALGGGVLSLLIMIGLIYLSGKVAMP